MLLAWIGWRSLPIHFHLLRRPHVLRGRCRHGTEAAGPRAVAPYVPRAAADTVLHGVVREHLETFLAAPAARTDGVGPLHRARVPRLLRCGLLVHGFLRLRCDDCAFERLVPLSCKGRAVCASCGGRRMAEQAANLIHAVLPWVPRCVVPEE